MDLDVINVESWLERSQIIFGLCRIETAAKQIMSQCRQVDLLLLRLIVIAAEMMTFFLAIAAPVPGSVINCQVIMID